MFSSSARYILNAISDGIRVLSGVISTPIKPIEKQLEDALRFTLEVCLIGSANKIDDIKRTGGFVLCGIL